MKDWLRNKLFSGIAAVALVSVLLYGVFWLMTRPRAISFETAVKMMKSDKDCIVVDVRTEQEYVRGHIPGAILVPLPQIRRGAGKKVKIAALPDKAKRYFLYCHSGRRSDEAAGILASIGYQRIYNLGGIVDWKGKLETGLVNVRKDAE